MRLYNAVHASLASMSKRSRLATVTTEELPSSLQSPTQCVQCHKVFSSEALLRQHASMFHSEKAFVCEICGKAFRFRSNLAEHRSVHTALKPYVCKFCGKSSRLKGNLTKHILKHHKKEQNAYIGKDDIIIKKGKKSVKDPAAVDFLEKSMIVLTPSGDSPVPSSAALQLYSMAQLADDVVANVASGKFEDDDDDERPPSSYLLGLGLDNGTVDLRDSSDHESINSGASLTSSDHHLMRVVAETKPDRSFGSIDMEVLPVEPAEFRPSSAIRPRVLSAASPPSAINKTQCPECGKHFRKGSGLQVHMTLNHGFPPPTSAENGHHETDKASDSSRCASSEHATPIGQDLKELKQMIRELRAASEVRQPRVEQLLTGLDARVGRLEKQLEMALNSIYTLVQLQTGMNSAVTRFRDDTLDHLTNVRSLLAKRQ